MAIGVHYYKAKATTNQIATPAGSAAAGSSYSCCSCPAAPPAAAAVPAVFADVCHRLPLCAQCALVAATPLLLPLPPLRTWQRGRFYASQKTTSGKYIRGGARARNLLLRRGAPHPLGHTSLTHWPRMGPIVFLSALRVEPKRGATRTYILCVRSCVCVCVRVAACYSLCVRL